MAIFGPFWPPRIRGLEDPFWGPETLGSGGPKAGPVWGTHQEPGSEEGGAGGGGTHRDELW